MKIWEIGIPRLRNLKLIKKDLTIGSIMVPSQPKLSGNCMKKLLEYIVRSIVDHPRMVKIEEKETEGQLSVKLTVHPEDLGMVIGKEGKIIKSVRRLSNILAIKRKKRFNLELGEG